MTFRSIKPLTKLPNNLRGARVIVRADLNVPMKGTKVLDEARIDAVVPTLRFLKKRGARIIVISHLGSGESLAPVAKALSRRIPVRFSDVPIKNARGVVKSLGPGDIVVLENLRRDSEEKKNDRAFARDLAALGDFYVNDAFSASHRAHASIAALPKLLPRYAGLRFMEELSGLSHILTPKHPFLFILGGAKGDTKLPLLSGYEKRADILFVGGALANDFFKTQGFETGRSIVSGYRIPHALFHSRKIVLPTDVIVRRGNRYAVVRPQEVKRGDTICDAGPESVHLLLNLVATAKLVVFNGPLGDYEHGCTEPTRIILNAIAKTKARTLAGGGDTTYFISQHKLEKKFTFVSRAGGAMLEFLAKGTLPGIEALKS